MKKKPPYLLIGAAVVLVVVGIVLAIYSRPTPEDPLPEGVKYYSGPKKAKGSDDIVTEDNKVVGKLDPKDGAAAPAGDKPTTTENTKTDTTEKGSPQ